MLTVKTKVKNSPLHGIGLFADEFIPKGTKMWVLQKDFDQVLTEENFNALPPIAQSYFKHFAYFNEFEGGYVLCGDNARVTNHYTIQNTECDKIYTIALNDIFPGEEITENYFVFNEKEPENPFYVEVENLAIPENEIINWGDLFDVLKTFTPAQLAQKAMILIDDNSYAENISSISEIGEDIYIYNEDEDISGSLQDIKDTLSMDNEPLDEQKLRLITPKTTIFAYNAWRAGNENEIEA